MALRMVALNRLPNGQFFSRKIIPVDVRDAYSRLYGGHWEAQLRQPADTPRPEAKTRHAEFIAEIETRIATLPLSGTGKVNRSLSSTPSRSRAGGTHGSLGNMRMTRPSQRWKEMSDHLVWDVIHPEAPDSYHENPKADPHWDWAKEPEVREAIRPQVAELARVATFLASEGMVKPLAKIIASSSSAKKPEWFTTAPADVIPKDT